MSVGNHWDDQKETVTHSLFALSDLICFGLHPAVHTRKIVPFSITNHTFVCFSCLLTDTASHTFELTGACCIHKHACTDRHSNSWRLSVDMVSNVYVCVCVRVFLASCLYCSAVFRSFGRSDDKSQGPAPCFLFTRLYTITTRLTHCVCSQCVYSIVCLCVLAC